MIPYFMLTLGLACAASLGASQERVHQDDNGPAAVPIERFLTSRTSGVTLPLPEEEDAFFFMVYGDRTGGPPSGVAMLRQAVRETNLIGPDLVMTVGDLINGYNEPKEWMAQMQEYQDAMAPLSMPWFPVAGNHDIYYRSRDRSAPIPAEEHEARYEMHFGPLWYAFKHKSAWFIVLYTEEPNPETGKRSFHDPASQTMSPEQFKWLDETLLLTKDSPHVFVFCHHPRWIGGQYGNDWARVHGRLKEAGNVKAVFGGHIHQMRYDPKDGIEYFALATIGGHQSEVVPEAGFLHCYDLVTVRKDRIERATFPLGAAMDPREITAKVSADAPMLTEVEPHWLGQIRLDDTGATDVALGFTITNPTESSVELEARIQSPDPRWRFRPDHVHGKLGPGGTFRGEIQIAREADSLDGGLLLPTMEVGFDYLTDTARFAIPRRTHWLPLDLDSMPPVPVPKSERVLRLDGGRDAAVVESGDLPLHDGPITVEAWVHPDQIKGRQGIVCKTERSEFGIFASGGELEFLVHMGGQYVSPTSKDTLLEAGRWSHVAGVFDGTEVRVYLDGMLVASEKGQGSRKRNDLPLVIGGDVRNDGRVDASLDGDIDEVRISSIARYKGPQFTPSRRFEEDDDTVLLLHMDGALGPYLRGTRTLGAKLVGTARVSGM